MNKRLGKKALAYCLQALLCIALGCCISSCRTASVGDITPGNLRDLQVFIPAGMAGGQEAQWVVGWSGVIPLSATSVLQNMRN